jgi:folylpolyglutamate synthase/dihydropteroate synthase
MPNLSSFGVLKQKVNKHKEDLKLETDTEAFTRLTLQAILRLNDDEVEDAITEGGMDGGLDAVHIGGRNVHFFNTIFPRPRSIRS